MKRHPRAVTSPPITAVSRVDLRLHTAIVMGDMKSATAVDKAPSHPVETRRSKKGLGSDIFLEVLQILELKTFFARIAHQLDCKRFKILEIQFHKVSEISSVPHKSHIGGMCAYINLATTS